MFLSMTSFFNKQDKIDILSSERKVSTSTALRLVKDCFEDYSKTAKTAVRVF